MIKNYIFGSLFLLIVISSPFASQQNENLSLIHKELAKLEASSGGRIGVFVISTANNTRLAYRADEFFPLQSTFKVMGVAAILKKSMSDSKFLQQKMTYTNQDLVDWSPITEKHLEAGMSISDLCAATLMYSDNTAINMLMKILGGPNAVNSFARSIGDEAFQLDHWEPELNSNPNQLSDFSTPAAMGESLLKLAFGNILALPQREQLIYWLKANTTGNSRIRAGTPTDWLVGDKTGTGDTFGVTNDIAIIWPTQQSPIIMTIYFNTKDKNSNKNHDKIIASASRIISTSLHLLL